MRRVIAIAVAGASLCGCSSMPSMPSLDMFKSAPPSMQVQLESAPPGADARTSLGPGCKTPCAVAVSAPDSGFSVAYTLNKFQPATVPVQVIRIPADFASPGSTTIDPNPVVAELQPAAPPPRAARKKILTPKKPKPPKAAASPAAAPEPPPAPAPTTR